MDFRLDETTRADLRLLQRQQRDKRVYVKVTVLLCLDQGYTPAEIETILGIDSSTIYRYVQGYLTHGLSVYLSDGWVAYAGCLDEAQQAQLKAEVRKHLYVKAEEVVAWVQAQFGVTYSQSGMVSLLHRLGFVYKKTVLVPSKADAGAQAAHVAELAAFMADKGADTLVFFNDGVHPQHNTRAEYGWILADEEYPMPSNTGRRRLNLTGAVNAEQPSEVYVEEAAAVNTQSTIALWERIEAAHPGKVIYHICDNARYYHSHLLQAWLQDHPNTQVWYLPPYSPNLNVIERLWKYLRKTTINSYFYETFAEFRQAILDFFAQIKEHELALTSLLTLRFHLPKN